MNQELKPYEKYKESDICWIDQIPLNWSVTRIKNLFTEVDERRGNNEYELLTFSRKRGLIPYSKSTNKAPSASDLSNYRVCKIGNLLMNRMQAWSGMLTAVDIEGIVSPDYSVFVASKFANVQYYGYLYRTTELIHEFAVKSKGVGAGFNRLYTPEFQSIKVILPPIIEQHQIVKYLNHQLAMINKFIKAKKKLISVLKEQKQAVINEAVTKGINPSVKMKPSGIDWIGDVPEHWEVRRIKSIAKILRGKFNHRPRNDDRLYNGEFPFIQTGDVARANKYIVSYKQTLNQLGFQVSKEFPKGTLVMTIAANIGDVAILDLKACFPDSIVGFIPDQNMHLEYLYYIFTAMKQVFLREAPVNTQGNLNIERVGVLCLGVPKYDEQKSILHWIEKRTDIIDKSISHIEHEIDLITEYRTRLISDVVTGKIDVRNIVIDDIIDEDDNYETDEEVLDTDEAMESEEVEG